MWSLTFFEGFAWALGFYGLYKGYIKGSPFKGPHGPILRDYATTLRQAEPQGVKTHTPTVVPLKVLLNILLIWPLYSRKGSVARALRPKGGPR